MSPFAYLLSSILKDEQIYREGARNAKDVKNKRAFGFNSGPQAFLRDLCVLAVQAFDSEVILSPKDKVNSYFFVIFAAPCDKCFFTL